MLMDTIHVNGDDPRPEKRVNQAIAVSGTKLGITGDI